MSMRVRPNFNHNAGPVPAYNAIPEPLLIHALRTASVVPSVPGANPSNDGLSDPSASNTIAWTSVEWDNFHGVSSAS